MVRRTDVEDGEETGSTPEYVLNDPPASAKVEVFLDILSNVALVLSNNVFEQKGVGRIVTLLGYAVTLVRDATQGIDELNAVNAKIQEFVDGGRVPSDEEWAVLDQRMSAIDARFAAVQATLK